MEHKPIKIILRECDCEKSVEQIIDELVKDTVKRIVAGYDTIIYLDDHKAE